LMSINSCTEVVPSLSIVSTGCQFDCNVCTIESHHRTIHLYQKRQEHVCINFSLSSELNRWLAELRIVSMRSASDPSQAPKRPVVHNPAAPLNPIALQYLSVTHG